jgi:hypothetical protein
MKIPKPRRELVIMTVNTAVFVGWIVLLSKEHIKENAERAEIRRQGRLDIEAIGKAAKVINERMDNPEYIRLGLANMAEDFSTEIEFQKIVVREDI